MRIFALDTAAKTCSVALWEDSVVLYEETLNLGLTHSETMQAACERALATLGWSYEDVDYYAVTQGPGSFTGVRIGLTAAKTFAYATNRPIIGLSSLAVLAEPFNTAENTAVLSLLDARHRRVYAGLYQNTKNLLEDRLGDIDVYLPDLAQICQAKNINSIILAGDCAKRYFSDEFVIQLLAKHQIQLSLYSENWLSAAALARLAAARLSENPQIAVNAKALEPIYLTATEAERGANFYV